MEQELKISIVNAQKIVRKETGEVMTKVDYMTLLEQTDNFYGYSVMSAWCGSDAFDALKPYLGKEAVAKIGMRKGKSGGLTAFIKKINNINL